MDKTMQEYNEMQDKELYALLEQALTDERLCVSEELIQKTLKKIETQDTVKTVPIQRARKNAWMRYSSVAAAAALVLVLGIGMKDGFRMKNATNESMPEMAADAPQETDYYYSSNKGAASTEDAVLRDMHTAETRDEVAYSVSEEPEDMITNAEEETVYLEGTIISVPGVSGNQQADSVTVTEIGETAEYWEFVDTGDDWVTELAQDLSQKETEAILLSENGTYSYAVACSDGSRRSIGSEEPLVRIVKVSVNGDVFWCLFGEELRVYKEN